MANVTCGEECTAECRSSSDSINILEIDSSGNLCGCGSSCNSVCGSECEGSVKGRIISVGAKINVPDVVKIRYGDSDIIDKSKNSN